jgi:hypothetical protein
MANNYYEAQTDEADKFAGGDSTSAIVTKDGANDKRGDFAIIFKFGSLLNLKGIFQGCLMKVEGSQYSFQLLPRRMSQSNPGE